MKITVFSASTPIGRTIVSQAIARGMDVVAFDRNIEHLLDRDQRDEHLHAVKGYVFDEKDVRKALEHSDAVISLIEGATDGSSKSRSLGNKNIIAQMENNGVKRLIVLADTAVLDADDSRYVMDNPDYPGEKLPVAQEYLTVLHLLQASSLDWTMVCAPETINADDSGSYITRADQLPEPDNAQISTGDLADMMLNELSENRYVKQRVGISRI